MHLIKTILFLAAFLSAEHIHAQSLRFTHGNRIQGLPSGNFYFVLDNLPRPISEELIKSELFLSYYMILNIPDSLLLFADMNKPIESLGMIKTYNDSIFLWVDEKRRHITSPEVAEAYSLNLSAYRLIELDQMRAIPKGDSLIFVQPPDPPPPCGVDDYKRD